jgi:hypothetical protein
LYKRDLSLLDDSGCAAKLTIWVRRLRGGSWLASAGAGRSVSKQS